MCTIHIFIEKGKGYDPDLIIALLSNLIVTPFMDDSLLHTSDTS